MSTFMNTMTSTQRSRGRYAFAPEPGNRAPAGAFGRRVSGCAAAAPADEFEVDRILARIRTRRMGASAPRIASEHSRRASEDTLAYLATGLSLLALSAISVLPMF
ncbi:MAG: hypothetical protein K9G30_00825 [Parvibaculum sp.]|nr:hypothetical protein [Parvibaculum sp.]